MAAETRRLILSPEEWRIEQMKRAAIARRQAQLRHQFDQNAEVQRRNAMTKDEVMTAAIDRQAQQLMKLKPISYEAAKREVIRKYARRFEIDHK